MASEQALQSKVIKLIEKDYNGYVVNGQFTRKGTPDLICCVNSLFVAFEVKLPTTRDTLTPIQQAHIDLIRASNGHAYMISSTDEVKAILDDLLGVTVEMEI